MNFLKEEQNGSITLNLHIQPKSSRNKISGIHGEALKICITSPPVDGKANNAVISFLAKLFNVPKSSITLKSGRQSKTKTFSIKGIPSSKALEILKKNIP